MSLKFRFFSILTIALGVALFSAFAMAQDSKSPAAKPDKVEKTKRAEGRHGNGMRRAGRAGFAGRLGPGARRGAMGMIRGANLTDEQRTRLRSIREANKPDPALMEEFRTISKARRDGTITPDQQARAKALRDQTQAKAKTVREQIFGVLTTEQKQQIEQRRQQMKERFEQRKQMRQQRQAKPAATDKQKIT